MRISSRYAAAAAVGSRQWSCVLREGGSTPHGDMVGTPRGDMIGSPRGDMIGSPRGDMIGSPRGDMIGSPRGDMIGLLGGEVCRMHYVDVTLFKKIPETPP